MHLQGHLLYIDITQICGIGCTFCMYANRHKTGMSMELSSLARANLAALINAADVKRISISGEGEPLNNVKVFHEILGLSEGGRCFEFITSGFFPHDKMAYFYETTDKIVSDNGDTCNIRLSADSHHLDKVKWRAHGFSLDYIQRCKPSGLSFSFRSIDTDRDFTRTYLVNELGAWGIKAEIKSRSILEDELITDYECYSIDYKNLVHPDPDTPIGYLDLFGYIDAIESKISKRFTFGSLNPSPKANGMDVTIKPNGDIYLYGIENYCLGNIHMEKIDWHFIANYVRENSFINTLYTQPLIDLLAKIENTELLHSIVTRVNNPYWLVKELSIHSGLLEQWNKT